MVLGMYANRTEPASSALPIVTFGLHRFRCFSPPRRSLSFPCSFSYYPPPLATLHTSDLQGGERGDTVETALLQGREGGDTVETMLFQGREGGGGVEPLSLHGFADRSATRRLTSIFQYAQDINLDLCFVVTNFILEIPSLVFDQLVSIKHPYYALLVMLISAMTLMICILGLICRVERGGYRWKWRGMNEIPWFYSPEANEAFGTRWELIEFSSAVSQLIITAINYSFICRLYNSPIKISLLPPILAFGLLCSKFLEEYSNNLGGRGRNAQNGSDIALEEILMV